MPGVALEKDMSMKMKKREFIVKSFPKTIERFRRYKGDLDAQAVIKCCEKEIIRLAKKLRRCIDCDVETRGNSGYCVLLGELSSDSRVSGKSFAANRLPDFLVWLSFETYQSALSSLTRSSLRYDGFELKVERIPRNREACSYVISTSFCYRGSVSTPLQRTVTVMPQFDLEGFA